MKFDFDKNKLLVLLLITDAVFILLHVLNVYTNLLNSSLYLLSRDRGYAEFFQYTKELWIAFLFLFLAVKRKKGIFYVFSLLFLYLMFDDSFTLHENLGQFLAEMFHFQDMLGLRAVDFGELLVSGLVGLLFLAALVLFYFLSDQFSRHIALYMGLFMGMLAFFGVALDMVEVIIPDRGIARVFTIIEEGGEMLVMSLITLFVYRIHFTNDVLPLFWLKVKDLPQTD